MCVYMHPCVRLSACPPTVQILEVCETAVGLQGYQSCLGFTASIRTYSGYRKYSHINV